MQDTRLRDQITNALEVRGGSGKDGESIPGALLILMKLLQRDTIVDLGSPKPPALMPLQFMVVNALKNLAVRHDQNKQHMRPVLSSLVEIITSSQSTPLICVCLECLYVLSFDYKNRHVVFNLHGLGKIINGLKETEGLAKIATDLELLHERMEQT